MPKHGACCLASINLSEFVTEPYTVFARFDYDGFVEAVHVRIRALDTLIDENYNRHPLKQQREMSFNYRNIGLGAFGYASALMKMGLTYGSVEANEFTDGLFFKMFRENLNLLLCTIFFTLRIFYKKIVGHKTHKALFFGI